MVFSILTVIAVISFVYCCDFPVLFGMNFLVNQKDSIWFAIGCSIIASYIFYCVQVVIPQISDEKKAYKILERRMTDLLSEAYHLYVFCSSICIVDRDNSSISIPTVYVLNIEDGKENPWMEKIIVDHLVKGICNAKKALLEDGYYMQLSSKIRYSLQPLMDNVFPEHLASSIKHAPMRDVDLIKFYDEYQTSVENARKALKITVKRKIVPYTDPVRIAEFESKLAKIDPVFLQENPTFIPFMKIR